MSYDVKIIKKHEQKTKRWSGGTTTEFAIFPEDADYGEKNFLWRISSAVVEDSISTFTYLPGVWREIMILEGEIKLEHKESETVELKRFEKHSFDGGLDTKSYGQVTDFNLMMKEGAKGQVSYIKLDSEDSTEFNLINKSNEVCLGFYCYEGSLNINIKDKCFNIDEKDFFMIRSKEDIKDIKVSNVSHKPCSLVIVKIIY